MINFLVFSDFSESDFLSFDGYGPRLPHADSLKKRLPSASRVGGHYAFQHRGTHVQKSASFVSLKTSAFTQKANAFTHCDMRLDLLLTTSGPSWDPSGAA